MSSNEIILAEDSYKHKDRDYTWELCDYEIEDKIKELRKEIKTFYGANKIMKNQIKKAKEMLKRGLVKKDSENTWTVGDELDYHIVVRDIKTGRSIFRCDCQAGSRFCNETPICYHLISVILFEGTKKLQKKIKKILKEYEGFKKINMCPDINAFIEDLKDIRGLA